MRKLRNLWAVALALLLCGGGVAAAEIIQAGNVDLRVDAEVKPRKLPADKRAPVRLAMSARIATLDGTRAPGLRHAVIDFDEQGSVYTKGLGRCRKGRIAELGAAEARRRCRRALVGGGTFRARLTPADRLPFEVQGAVSIFNTRFRGRSRGVLVHASLPSSLASGGATLVARGRISKAPGSIYGKRVRLRIPARIGSTEAQLTALRVRVDRRWRHKGRRRSFVVARCSAGNFVFRGKLRFADGTRANGSLIRGCRRR